MNSFERVKHQLKLSALFAVLFFGIMLLTLFLIILISIIMNSLGLTKATNDNLIGITVLAVIFLLIGTLIATSFTYILLSPITDIMLASDKISTGDYAVRVRPKGLREFKILGEKFNNMVKEIESVETLQSDFVNNFSHEFKTPIVSIRGFARMLKREDLTKKEREEYIDIIISESNRLAELSTNVLNLLKIEQTSTLTEKKQFNASEQIRLVIALLDSKWHEKRVDFSFDSEEVFLYGEEELLKQVWINLIDNAIKFSPVGGIIKIKTVQNTDNIQLFFANQGEGMSKDTIEYAFNKFYQGEASRSTNGVGLGLTIAKKIIQLHGGRIHVKQSDGVETIFEITIPNEKEKSLL